jgi:hypothetical protein
MARNPDDLSDMVRRSGMTVHVHICTYIYSTYVYTYIRIPIRHDPPLRYDCMYVCTCTYIHIVIRMYIHTQLDLSGMVRRSGMTVCIYVYVHMYI